MKTHELKLDINYFEDVKSGFKNFEIRKNDRDFQVGDILELKNFDGGKYQYFNEEILTYLDCRESMADTIKVKVVGIWNINNMFNEDGYVSDIEKAINLDLYEVILGDYFKSDVLPLGYVVMAIEVIE